MRKIDKKDFFIVIMLAVLSSYFMFCQISGDERGADRVREHLDAVGDKQQSVIGRLDFIESGLARSIDTAQEVARGLGAVEDSVDRTQERITASEARVVRSAEFIRQGKSILATVRERSEKKD